MKVIGLTGPLASGKTESAGLLASKGYLRVSLSDEVRKEADIQHRSHTRNVLQDVGDELRLKFGNTVLAQRVALVIEESQSNMIVVDGIKNPDEILFLRQKYGMKTIGVNANEKLRFKRILERQSESDSPLTQDEIRQAMNRDMGIGEDSHGNNITGCLKIVDETIVNDGSREELESKLVGILAEIGNEGNHKRKELDS